MRTLGFQILFGVCLAQPLAGQGVLIAPHRFFLQNGDRAASFTLYNPGPEPVEVTVETLFAYPVTDSAGVFDLHQPSEPAPDAPNAATFIQAFPRRLALAPGQRQTVRLLARPPADLPDGEYWSRIVVSARGGSVPVQGAEGNSGISVGLSLEVRSVLPLHFRKGRVTTGVSVIGVRTNRIGDSLDVRTSLLRSGSAAFLGTAHVRLFDGDRPVAAADLPLGVFTQAAPSIVLGIGHVPPGEYRLEVEILAERRDLQAGQVIPAPSVRHSIPVRLE